MNKSCIFLPTTMTKCTLWYFLQQVAPNPYLCLFLSNKGLLFFLVYSLSFGAVAKFATLWYLTHFGKWLL